MNLYNEYRPTSLDEVYGNVTLVSTLTKLFKSKKPFPQSIIFQGPFGSGKTTLARIVANQLGCEHPTEIDAAQFRGIDTVRELTRKTKFSTIDGKAQVFILDEIQKMQDLPQTALLKVFEDTPENVYFIICTTHPQKLIPTLVSRCMPFTVEVLADEDMRELLEGIADGEGVKLKDDVYDVIVENTDGHPRDAINLLEKVINTPKKERLKVAEHYKTEEAQVYELYKAMIQKKQWSVYAKLLKAFKEQGNQPETIRRSMLGLAANELLRRDNKTCGLILEVFADDWFDSGFTSLVSSCYIVCKG